LLAKIGFLGATVGVVLENFDEDAFSQYSEARVTHSPTVEGHSGLISLSPPPTAFHAENLQHAEALESNSRSDCRIMRHRHTIDHRANNVMMYARQSTRRTHATATSVLPPASQHFALPEPSRISNERAQMNQTIEQTAITSIISNYVTNYLNDMESRNPNNI